MSIVRPRTFQLKSGEKITIRSAYPVDTVQILDHALGIFQEDQFTLTEVDEWNMNAAEEKGWIQLHSETDGYLMLVAEIGGKIIGLCNFENGSRRKVVHSGELGMSVKKEWRGRGVGAALLRSLLDWAWEHPVIERVGLSVFANNERALHLYHKLGFQEEGRKEKGFKLSDGRYVDEILMAVLVKQSR